VQVTLELTYGGVLRRTVQHLWGVTISSSSGYLSHALQCAPLHLLSVVCLHSCCHRQRVPQP
jgi:hypothetical protein